jgi:hypothetical protein
MSALCPGDHDEHLEVIEDPGGMEHQEVAVAVTGGGSVADQQGSYGTNVG